MKPDRHGIWRFRTEDVRVIGWFLRKNVFVVSQIIDKATALEHGYDEASLSMALRIRALLDIDGGLWLNGDLKEMTDVE